MQAAKARPLKEELKIAANTPLPEDDNENNCDNQQEATAGASAQQVGFFSHATEPQSLPACAIVPHGGCLIAEAFFVPALSTGRSPPAPVTATQVNFDAATVAGLWGASLGL